MHIPMNLIDIKWLACSLDIYFTGKMWRIIIHNWQWWRPILKWDMPNLVFEGIKNRTCSWDNMCGHRQTLQLEEASCSCNWSYHPVVFNSNPNLAHLILIISWFIRWIGLVTTGVRVKPYRMVALQGFESPVMIGYSIGYICQYKLWLSKLWHNLNFFPFLTHKKSTTLLQVWSMVCLWSVVSVCRMCSPLASSI